MKKQMKKIAACTVLACMAVSAVGFANMWLAVFADVGVLILAVLNATRTLRINEE